MKKREKQLFGSEELLKNLLENFLIVIMREFYFREIEKEDGETSRSFRDEVVSYIDDNFLEKNNDR